MIQLRNVSLWHQWEENVTLLSLLEKNNHIVINIEANVAIRLVLHREAASEDDQTMPSLSELVIKVRLDVLRNVGVV